MKLTPGYLYIISNPSYPGFLKIGVTEDMASRLHVYQTGDPNRKYNVEYKIFHPSAYKSEKKIKECMKYFAKKIKKEWFEVDLKIAISRIEEQLDDYNNCPDKY